jgi:hypothetical protein
MLNCEYPGTVVFAKLAKALGFEDEYKHALYRAARREIPSVARLWFGDYINKYYGDSPKACIATGFSEHYGVKPVPEKVSKNFIKGGHDLFETSQGTYKELDFLLREFADERVSWYYKNYFLPSLKEQDLPVTFPTLRNLAIWNQMPLSDLEKEARKYEKTWDYWKKDWVGLKQCDQVGSLIYAKNPQVYICNWKPSRLIDSMYSPSQGTLEMSLDAGKGEVAPWKVEFYSSNPPKKIIVNGQPVSDWKRNDKSGLTTLSLNRSGSIKIKAEFK